MNDETKLYLIADINWEYNDNWYDPNDSQPVKVFKDRDYAILYMQEMERERRESIGHPLNFAGPLSGSTSLSEADLIERIKELYLPLPKYDDNEKYYDFWDWWDVVQEHLDPNNIDTYARTQLICKAPYEKQEWLVKITMEDVWALFDKLRFYRLIEIPYRDLRNI